MVVNGRFQASWPMECSKLRGQWNVPSFVANGMLQASWPMECCKLRGQWNVPSFVANGRWRKNTFSPLATFPPTILLKPSVFSLDLKVLLYHGPRLLLTHFLPFPQFINYDFAFQCNKSSTPSLSIWFWLKHWFLSFPWNYGITYGHLLWAPNQISEWRTAFGVISGFDLNATSSWWKTWNLRGARSSWSWTPSNLVLSYFSKLSTLVILLQVDPTFGNEPETIYGSCYETKDIFIFAWSLIPSVEHYHWLRVPIYRLRLNSKVDYLVRTIRRILDFLQLWIITITLPML